MPKDNIEFRLDHLDLFQVVSKPGTYKVSCGIDVSTYNLYEEDGYPRYLITLRVIRKDVLDTLVGLIKRRGGSIPWNEASKYFITGAIFKDKIAVENLPRKNENLIANFDENLQCNNLTLVPRLELPYVDVNTFNESQKLFKALDLEKYL